MLSIYRLKPGFQNLLRPAVTRLHAMGVTANQVTLAAAVVSVLLGMLLAVLPQHSWLFALIPLWMLLRMALNAVDGMLAREFGQQSRLGPCACRSPCCPASRRCWWCCWYWRP